MVSNFLCTGGTEGAARALHRRAALLCNLYRRAASLWKWFFTKPAYCRVFKLFFFFGCHFKGYICFEIVLCILFLCQHFLYEPSCTIYSEIWVVLITNLRHYTKGALRTGGASQTRGASHIITNSNWILFEQHFRGFRIILRLINTFKICVDAYWYRYFGTVIFKFQMIFITELNIGWFLFLTTIYMIKKGGFWPT